MRTAPADGDEEVLARARAGDEAAFAALVDRYHPRLIRLAATFVGRRDLAEDVAQETGLAALRGLEHFEGRSSLKSWLFQICANRARTLGAREQRVQPIDPTDAVVAGERFRPDGSWAVAPERWSATVADRLDDAALVALVRAAVDDLPDGQRAVVSLRDVEGLPAAEVCAVLGITEANQRVLLHRGRAQVRRRLERKVAPR